MIIAVVAGLLAFLATRFRRGTSRRVGTTAVTAVVCLALGAVTAAMASLNVALPDLARSTQATQTQLEWIIDAYSLVFAALLLPAGMTRAAPTPIRPRRKMSSFADDAVMASAEAPPKITRPTIRTRRRP